MRVSFDTENVVENIIFDLGNVVLDIDIQTTIDAFMKLDIMGLEPENIFPKPLPIFEEYERGLISSAEFMAKFREVYPSAEKISDDKFWAAWNSIFYKFDERRIKLIKKLSENYNVYLLSNTNEEHVRFFREMFREQFNEEFDSMFKTAFFSNEMLTRKPDREIYEKLISATGINPVKSLFIDDLKPNIEGAISCGLIGYHLTGEQTILDLFK